MIAYSTGMLTQRGVCAPYFQVQLIFFLFEKIIYKIGYALNTQRESYFLGVFPFLADTSQHRQGFVGPYIFFYSLFLFPFIIPSTYYNEKQARVRRAPVLYVDHVIRKFPFIFPLPFLFSLLFFLSRVHIIVYFCSVVFYSIWISFILVSPFAPFPLHPICFWLVRVVYLLSILLSLR